VIIIPIEGTSPSSWMLLSINGYLFIRNLANLGIPIFSYFLFLFIIKIFDLINLNSINEFCF